MTQLSHLVWLLLASLLLLLLLLRKDSRRKQEKETKGRLPPGPWRLPIIGNLHQLGASAHHSLHKLSMKHGPLMFLQLGSIPTLVVSSGDMAHEIFKSHDLAFSDRPALYALKKFSYGLHDMVVAPYGEYWRQVRKVSVLQLFGVKRVQSFRSTREEEVASLVASIARASSSGPINLSAMLLALTNNIICRIAFGSKHGGGYDQGGSRFHGTLAETQKLLGGFCVADFFPSLKWIHKLTGLEVMLEKNFKELDSFYDQVIEEHLRTEWPAPEHEDLVHVLLRLHKDPDSMSTFGSLDDVKGLLTVINLPLLSLS